MQMKFTLLAVLVVLTAFPVHAQSDALGESAHAWKARLSAHIAKSRFFPAGAWGQTGEARVGFVIDRSGNLVSRALAASSGSPLLDNAALEIVARAQCLAQGGHGARLAPPGISSAGDRPEG